MLLDVNSPRLQQHCDAYIFEEHWILHTVALSSLDFKFGTDSLR